MTGPRDVLDALATAPKPSWAPPPPRYLPVTARAMELAVDPLDVVAARAAIPFVQPPEVWAILTTSGLTQARLAAIVGIDEQRMGLLVRGKRAAQRHESEVLHLLRLVLEAMPNEADRRRWALALADEASAGWSRALLRLVHAGAQWRAGGAA